MKHTAVTIFVLSLLAFGAHASVYISHHGQYRNEDITFTVSYNWGNSTPTPTRAMTHFSDVHFQIRSSKGFTLHNRTQFFFEGRPYLFRAIEVRNSFFETGSRQLAGKRIQDNAVIRLEYEVRRKESGGYINTRKVVKTFKAVIQKTKYIRNAKIELIEIP